MTNFERMLEGLVGKHLETLRSFCDTLRVQLAKAEGIRTEVTHTPHLVVSGAEVTWQVEKSAMVDKLGIPGQVCMAYGNCRAIAED